MTDKANYLSKRATVYPKVIASEPAKVFYGVLDSISIHLNDSDAGHY